MIADRLVEDAYANFGECSGTAKLELDDTRITVDLDALTTRRARRL